MHIAVILFTVFAAWRYGDWKNWRKYHSTMLFISVGVLLYLYLYKNNPLWDLHKHLLNHTLTELLYAFIVLPLTVLLLLSNNLGCFRAQAYQIIKYIGIYSVIEFFYFKLGLIIYENEWSFWFSVGWNCMMFPMVVLHFKKPIYAYIASFTGLIIFLHLFPIKM